MSNVQHRGSVAVVGCGWLGLPLARELLARGYAVRGTTTRPERLAELEALGVEAHVLTLPLGLPDLVAASAKTAEGDDDGPTGVDTVERVFGADQLVLNVPPGRRDHEDDIHRYGGAILSAVLASRRHSPSGRVLFVSSTGVYGGLNGAVDETTAIEAPTPRAARLLLAESQVLAQAQRPALVVRLGGLYGGRRHPGRYLAGRTGLPDGDAPVNLTSRGRAVAAIADLLDHPFWTERLVNVVDPEHPTRAAYYTAFAQAEGIPPPSFLPGGADGKVVRSVSRMLTAGGRQDRRR